MRSRAFLFAACVVLTLPLTSPGDPPKPEQVLPSGKWIVEFANGVVEKVEIKKDGTGYAEAMTVRQDGASINMILRHFDVDLRKAWEERTAPMIFTAASCEGTSAIFDGQGDHAGEHLTYKRTAEGLTIIGDFLHHGKPVHVEWKMIAGKD